MKDLAIWASRSLQHAVEELSIWSHENGSLVRCGPLAIRAAKAALDLQEQVGLNVLDHLDEHFPDWIDDIAEETWDEVGGW